MSLLEKDVQPVTFDFNPEELETVCNVATKSLLGVQCCNRLVIDNSEKRNSILSGLKWVEIETVCNVATVS